MHSVPTPPVRFPRLCRPESPRFVDRVAHGNQMGFLRQRAGGFIPFPARHVEGYIEEVTFIVHKGGRRIHRSVNRQG